MAYSEERNLFFALGDGKNRILNGFSFWERIFRNQGHILFSSKTPNIFISQYIRTLPACFFNHKWYFFQETDRIAKRLP
jgi:hypothetical protein